MKWLHRFFATLGVLGILYTCLCVSFGVIGTFHLPADNWRLDHWQTGLAQRLPPGDYVLIWIIDPHDEGNWRLREMPLGFPNSWLFIIDDPHPSLRLWGTVGLTVLAFVLAYRCWPARGRY